MTPEDIEASVRLWLGVPYRKKGRSRSGIDCLGLIVCAIALPFDIPHYDLLNYMDEPDPKRTMLRLFQKYCGAPARPELSYPGTIGIFAETNLPGHTGVFTWKHDRLHVVHARIGYGVLEEEYPPARQIGHGYRMITRFPVPGCCYPVPAAKPV